MIQIRDLSKQFKRNEKNGLTDFYAVDHLSFIANKGEILGILGPNGAGKTTLLRMLGGLMQPTGGSIIYDAESTDNFSIQKDIQKDTQKDIPKNISKENQNVIPKENIGYLSGNTKLYHRFSIREFLTISGEIYGLSKNQIECRIEEISDLLDLHGFIDNRIEKLSTGQTQRANIARCLIHSPETYIFDEPTLGLDILSSEAIIEFMKKERCDNKTILYSTHYMEEAQYLCDRIIMMNQGQIIIEGTPVDIMEITGTNNLRDAFKEAYARHNHNDKT